MELEVEHHIRSKYSLSSNPSPSPSTPPSKTLSPSLKPNASSPVSNTLPLPPNRLQPLPIPLRSYRQYPSNPPLPSLQQLLNPLPQDLPAYSYGIILHLLPHPLDAELVPVSLTPHASPRIRALETRMQRHAWGKNMRGRSEGAF
jgi:hypothetical protein